ncbi:hypothetical protein CXB77_06655 [Chromatium okenii]|uniref:Uncharacterized protein n=2 Tax=Chromatium okenii TaxID=61644 RepID=A0A2S7XS25_9GAMM|nr:hypothetical protein CXB77_06655 [Chromatium okenii]
MTPPQVFRALTQLGVTTLVDTITAIEAGNVVYQPQDLTQATDATRQRARLEAYLDFQHDDAAMIDRRRRAFLSQDMAFVSRRKSNNRFTRCWMSKRGWVISAANLASGAVTIGERVYLRAHR